MNYPRQMIIEFLICSDRLSLCIACNIAQPSAQVEFLNWVKCRTNKYEKTYTVMFYNYGRVGSTTISANSLDFYKFEKTTPGDCFQIFRPKEPWLLSIPRSPREARIMIWKKTAIFWTVQFVLHSVAVYEVPIEWERQTQNSAVYPPSPSSKLVDEFIWRNG